MTRISVGLVGVTGYTGMELARLLTQHAAFRLVRATSRSEAGKALGELYPFLLGHDIADLTVAEPDVQDLASACELVFLAVPHGAAMEFAGALRRDGVKVVDLSADFRLRDPAVYAQWYGLEHRERDLLTDAVYGLPEVYEEQIRAASLVANPGCYPTGSILGLAPALQHGLVRPEGIVIDAKSGTTGAGRKASVGTLFCEVADTFRAYNLTRHRHTPEIEQELSALTGTGLELSFNTHLLPINRGILSTIYTTLARKLSTEEAAAVYRKAYQGKPWVRVLPPGSLPETRHVRGSMFCDIGLVVDPRVNRLIIVTAIDNLCRGASGMALANANLMNGLDPAEGLRAAPLTP
jgi:N-acetyl-gamma-glutamyl-phosphate reductase